MSQRDIEILRESFEAFEREGVEALLAYIDPEFEVTVPPNVSVEPDTYRGHDGVRRYFESFYEVMDEVHLLTYDYIPVGDRVVAVGALKARGRETGIEAEIPTFTVCTFRDGKILGFELFVTLDEAMEAAEWAS